MKIIAADDEEFALRTLLYETENALPGSQTLGFSCDLYEYEKGSPAAINAFKGIYMDGYKWAAENVRNIIK